MALLVACAPAGQRDGGVDTGPRGDSASARPKVITVAVQRELAAFVSILEGSASGNTGGASNPQNAVHDQLVVENDRGLYEPRLAREQISVETGTWRLNPDGTMDTIWSIRPNVKWHDGTPFTSTDLLFSFTVFKDPDLPTNAGREARLVQSASAPDAHTFILHWSQPFADADQGAGIGSILPRHLVEDVYLNDKAGLANSPLLSTEFVGLGPYRLVKWEQGSHLELTRFDAYYLGRPPLDRLVFRFIADPNTMVANIMSQAVDVVLPTGVEVETALEVKRRWEGTGNQVRTDPQDKLTHLEIQYRPEYARPAAGLQNVGVRQALYHAIDRQGLTDILTEGISPVADSWLIPGTQLRIDVESSIPQFTYEPTRAQELLGRAGWARASDGVMVHQATGERFEISLSASAAGAGGAEKLVAIVGDGWKLLGAQPSLNLIAPARIRDAEFMTTYTGVYLTEPSGERFYKDRLHTRSTPTAASRWVGFNRGAYVNPKVDEILDRLNVTLNLRDRIPLHRQLVQEQMGDVALFPLYWGVRPILMLKGITGPIQVRNDATWNIFQWDCV